MLLCFADTKVSVNGGPYVRLINDTIDLGSQKWTPLKTPLLDLTFPKKCSIAPPEKKLIAIFTLVFKNHLMLNKKL